MTLRETIERLEINYILGCTGRFVDLDDVLRIIAEHEQETKGGGEPARTDLPGHHVTALPVGQAGGEETHAEYVARLRKDVDDCRRALEEAKRRTSLYDHEQEMLEYAEEELAEALESAAEVEQMARDADGGSK